MIKNTILSSLKKGNFTLHSGKKTKYLFDIMKLIRNEEFQNHFYEFIHGKVTNEFQRVIQDEEYHSKEFLVGIEFGGAILASIDSGYTKPFAIIRKDGTIYGDKIPDNYILLDDVVTTENSIRKAIEAIGKYPEEIKCIVDRRDPKNKSLHIESMLEWIEPKQNSENIIQKLREQINPQRCSKCPNPLFDLMVSSDTEPYHIGKDLVCRECYFKELGEEIEKHPIGLPIRR